MPAPLRELRHAARLLLKNPASTCVAVASLALSIGANTAVFSVVNAVLVRPLPYAEPDRILQVWGSAPERGADLTPLSRRRFAALETGNQVFTSVAAFTTDTVTLTGAGEPVTLRALRASHTLLGVLGVKPALGRDFVPEEDVRGGPRAVLLGDEAWRRRFGADPRVVGSAVTIDGAPHTVAGILPAGFEFPDGIADVWVPRVFEPSFLTEGAIERGAGYLSIVARLKPGVTREHAQAALDVIAAGDRRSEGLDANLDYRARPIGDLAKSALRPALLILLGAVGLVLMIACANVANLLLARSSGRRKEIAVRAVLGAGRGRLILLFLTESVLIAAVAAAAGLLIARWALDLIVAAGGAWLPRVEAIGLDATVLGVTTLLAVLTGLAFGLAPALHASKADLSGALREGGGGSIGGRGSRRIRGALVVAETALSVVLMIGAGLLIRSFVRLMTIEPGFNPHNVLAAGVNLPPSRYATPAKIRDFYGRLSLEISSLPGVLAAGAAETLPLRESSSRTLVAAGGKPAPPPGERAVVSFNTVTPGYFRTMGIPLRAGRLFTDDDNASAPIRLVVSESFARRFFPEGDPVGRQVVLGRGSAAYEVVGVVGDIRSEGLDTAAREFFYMCAIQRAVPSMTVVVRTTGDIAGVVAAIRERVLLIDKDQPVAPPQSMEEVISTSLAGRRFILLLVASFAALALLLAAAGIYSVTAYSVSRRTAEIGLRLALGARGQDVLRLVVGKALRLTLIGVGVGLAGALGVTRLMSSLLFGVGAADPATFTAIALLLTGVSFLASCLPALRATRIDPLVALRSE